jgi:hypothetical protein
MLQFSLKILAAWLVIMLLGALAACVGAVEYPSSLAASQLPQSLIPTPRLASFCSRLSPSLLPFCSHVTYPVFHSKLVSDGEWKVATHSDMFMLHNM